MQGNPFPFTITLAFFLSCSHDLCGFINAEGLALQGINQDAVDGILSVFGYVSIHRDSKPGNQHCGYARAQTSSYRLVPLNCFSYPRDQTTTSIWLLPNTFAYILLIWPKARLAACPPHRQTSNDFTQPGPPHKTPATQEQCTSSRQPESTITSPSYRLFTEALIAITARRL